MSGKISGRNIENKKSATGNKGRAQVSVDTATVAVSLKALTPLDVYRLTTDALKPSAIFEKYDRSCSSPEHSIVALDPEKVIYVQEGVGTVVDCIDGSVTCQPVSCPFTFLSGILAEITPVPTSGSAELPFSSGLIGYLGYGLTALVEKVERQEYDPFHVPDLGMFVPSTVISFDHQRGETSIISKKGLDHAESLRELLLNHDREVLERTGSNANASPSEPSPSPISSMLPSGFESAVSKDEFLRRVARTREYIEEGQAFQIVLSQRFYKSISVEAIDIYEELIDSTPSTYNYLLNFNTFQYLGASPETMMNCQNRKIRICALAGTKPRGTTYDEDILNEMELRQNEKEMAEHMMLVDLGRNDLGKICTPGSIELGTIAQVLRYSNVMHLGTEITGTLDNGLTVLDAAKSCFPRGTVSGAPKVRAMQLLSGLESERRGIYAGSVGYIDARGSADLAIAIRSTLIKDGVAHVNAGAGIVYDSNPESEYLETLHKSSAVTSAIHRAQQASERRIETQRTTREHSDSERSSKSNFVSEGEIK